MTHLIIPEISRLRHKRVIVDMYGGRKLSGICTNFDEYSNLILLEANDISAEEPREVGVVLLRGNMIRSLKIE